ncbi:hypothetical protein PILCRDRAFT_128451 [Piloderma croceum F 1598]|uniref:Uncharacterized protein n=1 Tax=Piloderma croceum (strain F 1598) TaxID=765440 RepID=A0A0C3GLC9_PILCF|nr:hypothetical protein PILCRDRAFT_128451 [Piloderma croceum F 1598]
MFFTALREIIVRADLLNMKKNVENSTVICGLNPVRRYVERRRNTNHNTQLNLQGTILRNMGKLPSERLTRMLT